jgi:Flp pilus assembly protein TadG
MNPPIRILIRNRRLKKSNRRIAVRLVERRGAAIVEFAVCLPIIVMLILGSIEAANAIFVRQALTTSAYEGVREATKTGAETNDAIARAQAILDARSIRNATISFTPADVETAGRGDTITIEVSARFSSNSPFIGRVIPDLTTIVRTVMVKE